MLVAPRHLRRRAALRRRHDHAGDLGARRRRGPRGRRRRLLAALRRADHGRDPGRAVPASSSTARTGSAGCSARSWCSGSSRSRLLGVVLDRRARRSCSARSIPRHARQLLRAQRLAGFVVLGAVFLVVTGGEALYADMGHFGRARSGWPGSRSCCRRCCSTTSARARCSCDRTATRAAAVLPAGAGVGAATRWSASPPRAAIIASQALISGAFSLTRQAIQLGYAPRLDIEHTSSREMGQIYVPQVNWVLMVATIADRRSASARRARWPRPTASPSR